MRMFKFSKPKGPGFGISRQFYLSVLSTKPVLPPLLAVVNPHGEQGSIAGFGAPLASGKGKEDLARPMERGIYAVASKDRKSVLKMLALSKEEAGFDPEAVALSSMSVGLEPEALDRIRATWSLLQLTFESHDPEVYPSLDFLLSVCARLADLTDGVVADPVAQRYLLPDKLFMRPRLDPKVDVREHVGIKGRVSQSANHVYTLGFQKFGLPELELDQVPDTLVAKAEGLLLAVGQSVLLGRVLHAGDRFEASGGRFEARAGGLDRGLWEGVPCLELLPERGSTEQALSALGSG